LVAAQELAEWAGVDVDTFIAYVVHELRDEEAREGAVRARAAQSAATGRVIQMTEDRRRRR
jgi:hypothetical protein